MKMKILAADIGATHSRFAIFKAYQRNTFPLLEFVEDVTLPTQQFSSFASLLEALKETKLKCYMDEDLHCTAFAPPGPVTGGVCRPTNISWDIDINDSYTVLHSVNSFLVNDFVAQGYAALYCLSDKSNVLNVQEIWKGESEKDAPFGVVGAGTGCGKAIVLSDILRVLPTEGGNADFPFITAEEWDFCSYLQKTTGTTIVVGDAVVSGSGFAALYAYHSGKAIPAQEVTAYARSEQGKKDPACLLALEWYARFYGRVCKMFILDTLSLGGLYITGGMASHIPILQQPAFLESLHDNPKQSWLLKQVPVYHITNQQAGLYGAAVYATLQFFRSKFF